MKKYNMMADAYNYAGIIILLLGLGANYLDLSRTDGVGLQIVGIVLLGLGFLERIGKRR